MTEQTPEVSAEQPAQPASEPVQEAPAAPAPEVAPEASAASAAPEAPATAIGDVSLSEDQQPGQEAPEPDPVKISEETDIDPALVAQFDNEPLYNDPDSVSAPEPRRPAPAGPADHPRIIALRKAGLTA